MADPHGMTTAAYWKQRCKEAEAERDKWKHQFDTRFKVYDSYDSYRNRAEQAEAEVERLRVVIFEMDAEAMGRGSLTRIHHFAKQALNPQEGD